jgi:hypothetical protein
VTKKLLHICRELIRSLFGTQMFLLVDLRSLRIYDMDDSDKSEILFVKRKPTSYKDYSSLQLLKYGSGN